LKPLKITKSIISPIIPYVIKVARSLFPGSNSIFPPKSISQIISFYITTTYNKTKKIVLGLHNIDGYQTSPPIIKMHEFLHEIVKEIKKTYA